MNIVNVGSASSNYHAINIKGGKMLVDCSWPGRLPQFIRILQRKNISLNEFKYLLVSPLHPDHARPVRELKNPGTKFILPECQSPLISSFGKYFKEKLFPS